MSPSLAAPTVGPMAPFRLPEVERATLDNGLVVATVSSGSIPKTSVRLVLGFGTGSDGPDETWLTRLLGDYLKEGAGDLDTAGLADAIARMGGRLNINVEEDTITISASVLSDHAPELVRVLATVARAPRLPETELKRLQADLIRRLDYARSQPETLASSVFRGALYGDHAYSRLLATPEQIGSFTTEAVRTSFAGRANPTRAHLYVAGMFDRDPVLSAASEALGDWKGASAGRPAPPTATSARTIHLMDRPGAEQSTLSIGLPVPDPTHDDYVALSVTNSLLGGSFYSRITLNIREDKGYTYSPRSQVVTHPRDAYWAQLADVTTNVTGASLHEIFAEIDRLRSEPPTSEELEGIQSYVAGNYVLRHATPGGILDQLEFLDLHGLDEGWAAAYTDKVLLLTAADVQRITVDHLRSDDMTIVIVGDASGITEEISAYGEIVEVALA